MMRGLGFNVRWLEPAAADDAFGAERCTWAELSLTLDGALLTANHPADLPSSEDRPAVVGGMSGLAEWIVESWPYILWETHPPFPRAPAQVGSLARLIPGLRDAQAGWPRFDPDEIPRKWLAAWQHRHSLGHASSPLALPSVVFQPEERQIAVVVDHAPTQLDPTVRFSPPERPDAWPSEPSWLAKEDLVDSLTRFVSTVLERARDCEEGRDWAAWLHTQFDRARRRAADADERRKLMFGELVAREWQMLAGNLCDRMSALEGLLADSSPPVTEQHLSLLSALAGKSDARARREVLPRVEPARGMTPHEQGYRLAEKLRRRLGVSDQPIVDLAEVLLQLGASIERVEAKGLFRSAVVGHPSKGAVVFYATDIPGYGGLAPIRFAVAASLGRMLSASEEARSGWFGAAHGPQARFRETQRANAFAAEFLLPGTVVSKCAALEDLCEAYGISRQAAAWHQKNALQRVTP